MWRTLTRLFRPKVEICHKHDNIKYPHILSNEQCQTCEINLCYMCGNDHIDKGCHVATSRHACSHSHNHSIPDIIDPTSREAINQKILSEFNLGSLLYLDVEQLKCSCGKPANEHTALCAACGSATCSTECHNHLVEQGKCSFDTNFQKKEITHSLRSILIRNAYYLFDKGYASGTLFSRSSQHFISAYISTQRNGIFLQRGHRQYGNPDVQTLNAMSILKDGALDKAMNLLRICVCKCLACQNVGQHPVLTCHQYCRSQQSFDTRTYLKDNQQHSQELCECRCEFCTSSLTQMTHQHQDCFTLCSNRKQYQSNDS